jgi:SAM-dependent methyltransferase
VPRDWQWDPSLYAGAARHYATGRFDYPAGLAAALAPQVRAGGRLLDVGCGPGTFTRAVAGLFGEVVAVDPDAGMLEQAARSGVQASWVRRCAEDLPGDLGTFDAITFAQSFHWVDQPQVAAAVRGMLRAGGACVLVQATTHRGVPGDEELPHPRPPHERMDALVTQYLGPVRRAGAGTLPQGFDSDEDAVMRAAGFNGPTTVPVASDGVLQRSADQVVSSVHSLSQAVPHQFGEALPAFDAELRALLLAASPAGVFSERARDIMLQVWR